MTRLERKCDSKRWKEVLRRAGMALSGRPVSLWESDHTGRLRPLASNRGHEGREAAASELEAELRKWFGDRPAGTRWVASRLRARRWCAAPVRAAPWQPPPGAERRSRERMTLELAGLCIGLLGGSREVNAPASGALHMPERGERLVARIVDQVPGVLWTADTQLRITSRAGAGARAFDLLPERVVGVSLLELHELRAASSESIEAHRRALGGESVSYAIRRGDTWYDAHVEPLRNSIGATVGVVGSAMDVSDRERARDDARRSRQDLDDFFDNIAVPVHWAAADGSIVRANRAELDMLGYAHDEYVGRNIAEFHLDPVVAGECLRRLGAGETLLDLAVQLRHKDGSTRHALISANVRFDHGQFVHACCVTRDVMNRNRAAEHLHTTRARQDRRSVEVSITAAPAHIVDRRPS